MHGKSLLDLKSSGRVLASDMNYKFVTIFTFYVTLEHHVNTGILNIPNTRFLHVINNCYQVISKYHPKSGVFSHFYLIRFCMRTFLVTTFLNHCFYLDCHIVHRLCSCLPLKISFKEGLGKIWKITEV